MQLTDKAQTALINATSVSGDYTIQPGTHHSTRRSLVRNGLVQADGWTLTAKGEELRTQLRTELTPQHKVWGHDGSGWRLIGTAHSGREHAEFLARDARENLVPHTYGTVIITDGDADPETTYQDAMTRLRAGATPAAEHAADVMPVDVLANEVTAQGPIAKLDTSADAVARRERAAKLRDSIKRTRAVLGRP